MMWRLIFYFVRCSKEFNEVLKAIEVHRYLIGLTLFLSELLLNMKVCFLFKFYSVYNSYLFGIISLLLQFDYILLAGRLRLVDIRSGK